MGSGGQVAHLGHSALCVRRVWFCFRPTAPNRSVIAGGRTIQADPLGPCVRVIPTNSLVHSVRLHCRAPVSELLPSFSPCHALPVQVVPALVCSRCTLHGEGGRGPDLHMAVEESKEGNVVCTLPEDSCNSTSRDCSRPQRPAGSFVRECVPQRWRSERRPETVGAVAVGDFERCRTSVALRQRGFQRVGESAAGQRTCAMSEGRFPDRKRGPRACAGGKACIANFSAILSLSSSFQFLGQRRMYRHCEVHFCTPHKFHIEFFLIPCAHRNSASPKSSSSFCMQCDVLPGCLGLLISFRWDKRLAHYVICISV